MKNRLFLSLFFLLAFAMSAFSQSSTGTLTNSGDTVTNAATVNLIFRKYQAPTTISFHLVNTKVSGTVAGKSYLESSNDAVNYVAIDSMTNTNVTTNQKIFKVTTPTEAYYRIKNVGTGTMVYTSRCTAHSNIPKN